MESWQGPTGGAAVASTPVATTGGPGASEDEDHDEAVAGRVRIARRVLRTIVREAALGVAGVTTMAARRTAWSALLGRPRPRDGVALAVRRGVVSVDLYLLVASGASMVDVGEAVQEAVAGAIEHMLGMAVDEVNVYIRDVA
jgi:uncharacterized alkaline shock family protein YloU